MCAALIQMDCAPIKHQECDRYRAEKDKRREEETMRLQREFAANTDTLRAFVDQHNLRNVDPSGARCGAGELSCGQRDRNLGALGQISFPLLLMPPLLHMLAASPCIPRRLLCNTPMAPSQ